MATTGPLPQLDVLRRLLHAAPGPACIVGLGDSRFLDANDELLAMLDYARDELLGRSAQELGVWRDEPARSVMEELARRGKARSVPLRFYTREGEARTCLASLDVVTLDGHRALLATCVDVTTQHAEELRLRESEERFRRAFEDAPIGMAIFGPTGTYLRVNRALCDMLGRREDEIVGKEWKDFTHPDDIAPVHEQGERFAQPARPTAVRLEKRYLKKDGSVVWATLTSSVIRDDEGKVLQFVTQVQDVTEQKRAEEALRGQMMARTIVRRLLVSIIHRGRVGEAVVREVGRELARERNAPTLAEALHAFQQLGFGELRLAKEEGSTFTFHGDDLLERRGQSPYPTCYLTLSYLEGALAHVAGGRTLGTETQCQSKGHEHCVFVLVRRDA